MGVLESLLRSRKFWLAVFGVATSIVAYVLPDFPRDIWLSIEGLVIVLIGTIAYEDAAVKRAGGEVREEERALEAQ